MKANNVVSTIRIFPIFPILIVILLFNCTRREDPVRQRLNPLDPMGDNYKPHIISSYVSISPVWSDFSFKDSTGSLQCSLLQVFKYVTIEYSVNKDSIASHSATDRMIFDIAGFRVNKLYNIRFTGYLRNGEVRNELFIDTTPGGMPPLPPEGFNGEGKSYGAQLRWDNMAGALKYRLLKSTPSGFTLQLPLQDTTSYKDFLPDHEEYTYWIGSVNDFGTAFSTIPVMVRKIASIIFPNTVIASKGLYPDYITVNWNPVSEASAYRIYRSTASDGIYVCIAAVSDTMYVDSTISKELFYYRVASINDSGYTGRMGTATAGFVLDSLDVPDSLNATRGVLVDKIMVFWKQVKGAASYTIYKSSDSIGVFLIAGTVPGDINFFTDSSVTRVLNYYKVSAIDTNGIETEKSATVAGSIKSKAIPENVTATQGSDLAEIIISWDPVKDASRYFIYRAKGNADTFSLLGSTNASFFHDSIESDSVMYYKVNCRIDGIESEYSNVVTGWVASKLAPANITASLGTYSSYIEIQWRPVPGAVRYIVYRATDFAGLYLPIATIDTNRYNDTTILTDDYYFYRVAAVAPNEKVGVQSEYVQGFADVVGRPMDVSATILHPSKVYVRWKTVKEAQYYIVFCQTSLNGTASVLDTVSDSVFIDTRLISPNGNYYSVTAGIRNRLGFRSVAAYGAILPPPSPVIITSLENGAMLKWSRVASAYQYKVYRSVSDTSHFNLYASTSTSIFIDSLSSSNNYYYKVTSCSDSGESEPTQFVSFRYVVGPGKLNSKVTNDTVVLSWNQVNGISTYYIYRAEKPDTVFASIGVTGDTTFKDAGLLRSGNYYYYIRGYISLNSFYTSMSPVVKAFVKVKPLAPVPTTTASYSGYIRIAWTPNTAGTLPTAYVLYRSLSSSGIYSPLDTITGLYYNDSVSSTSTYYYKVSGIDSTGEGSLSSYISGYAYSPAAPVVESASWDQFPNGILYIWKRNTDAVSYIVYRAPYSGGTKTVLDTVKDTVFFDTSLSASVTGYYSIKYLNSHGLISSGSSETAGRRLGPPISISVSGYVNYISLSWSGSSTPGIYYKVYRSTSSDGSFTILDSTFALSYNDTVSSLSTYYYKISSVKNGESQLSAVYSGRLTTPSAPVMVSASMGMTTVVQVIWNKITATQSYKLYRSTSSSFFNPSFVANVADTSFLDTVPSDSIYYYKCKAVSIAGESSLSSVSKSGYRFSSSPPPVPVSLYVSNDVSSHIYMHWSMSSNIPMVSQYKIYRSEIQGGPFQLIDSTSEFSYMDYVPKTYPDSYWYYITSRNSAGESAPSDTVSGYRP
jgi:fibronectin type 3 domain-containing protein